MYIQQQSTWIILCTWITLEFTATHLLSFATEALPASGYLPFLLLPNQNRYANEIFAHLFMTNHMGNICAYYYQHTEFCHCSPYRTLDICIFLSLANQNKYANKVLNIRIDDNRTHG